jgi:aminoglycoside phosphotransferase (APT) family kinase protein
VSTAVLDQARATEPVRHIHRFDEQALAAYLADHVEGFSGSLTVRQFVGGQSNPTYHLEAGGKEYVLRRKPPGKLLPSAHAVDREYRVITALAGSGVPVPRTHVLCEDPSIIGTIFFVMDCVHGRLFALPWMPDIEPAERTARFDAMNQVLARLHTVDWRAAGLESFGRPGNYFERQIHRWITQYRASETERIDSMERLIEWLPGHVPAAEVTAIVHGDFRPGNMIMDLQAPRIAAVLDWELSTLGHPLADLGYHCIPYHLGSDLDGMADLDLGALGIPPEKDYVASYCRRTGRDGIVDLEFYVAFSLFRLGAIAQGIMGRVLAGTASDANARLRGERARPMADAAWALIAPRV